MTEKKPYYLTTAIAYTSGRPHIGNTYEIILSDAVARYRRSQGYLSYIYYINNQLISNFDSSLSISSKARKGTVISFVVPVVEVESYE
mgnify:CR=1 FL=1